jgi:hypothetical protein
MAENILEIPVEGKIWFANLGIVVPSQTTRRRWIACKEYGFISAGQTHLDVGYISKLAPKDIICAYESKAGFKAIGRVLEKAIPILQFKLDNGKSLRNLPHVNMGNIKDRGLFQNEGDMTKCEYVAKIFWYDLISNSLWIPKGRIGFYAPRNTVAELKYQETKEAIEKHFKVKFV